MAAIAIVLLLLVFSSLHAQSAASIQGRVLDPTGLGIPDATISARNPRTSIDIVVRSDAVGRFTMTGVPVGVYLLTASAPGFRAETVEAFSVEVGRTMVRDFRLEVGGASETVIVPADLPLVDRATTSVGHVVTARTIQEIPLNGRHFTDLGLLVPGSMAPSQTGFSTTPSRGLGALAINTAGNREEAVAFMINGVTTNNLVFGSLSFQPPVASIQEFKIDNSAFSAEYGHASGAVVNIATRSGTNAFHGDAFAFLRDEALDARNFFEFTSPEPHPFERHQLGGTLGGPIVRGRAFFFATYEGLRQRQGLDVNSLVLSDAERASATSPVVRRLIGLIPPANYVDSSGTPRFVGAAEARVENDRWTADVRYHPGARDRFHAFHGHQAANTLEPTTSGNTVPGFGHRFHVKRSVSTLNHTRTLASTVNELRVGRSTLEGGTMPAAALNPLEFRIQNGVTRAIGLPQMVVAGGLNFGGPANFPAGRRDTSYIASDTLTAVRGRHTVRVGGEYRHFHNENIAEGTGTFNFPSVAAFLAGVANAFSITLGERRSHIDQRAVSMFVQDTFLIRPTLTIEAGLRYEWHVTPTERDNRFVVFDPATARLLRVGVDIADVYRQNNRNVEPRIGIAWDPVGDGRFVLRAAYRRAVDEPGTTVVTPVASNPPSAMPLTATGSIPLDGALSQTRTMALSPATVDHGFRNASVQSWNVNVQRALARDLAAMAGYFGSRGTDLRISRNINQPRAGVRPFAAVSPDSAILPNASLGNIMQAESSAFSSYHALWLSASKRLSHRLQFDVSYTWSKSLDTNSLNSSGFAIQDAYDIPNQYGLSDYDARHRFVGSASYTLPSGGHWLTRGWHLACVVQSQSGNPVNIVTSTSTVNGVPNSVRPDLTGPIRVIGSVEQWFDTSAFTAVDRFGTLGRNVVIGPAFHNTDLSVSKRVPLRPGVTLQLRLDVFDVFNHANFGPPGNIVGTPTFGRITRTRLPTGEAGSSRQLQLGASLTF